MSTLAAMGGRKFLLAILGVIAIILSNKFGIDQTTVLTVGGVLITTIFGQSLADGLSNGATSSNAVEQGRINIVLKENDVKVATIAHETAKVNADAAQSHADAAKSNAVTAAIEAGHVDKADTIAEIVKTL